MSFWRYCTWAKGAKITSFLFPLAIWSLLLPPSPPPPTIKQKVGPSTKGCHFLVFLFLFFNCPSRSVLLLWFPTCVARRSSKKHILQERREALILQRDFGRFFSGENGSWGCKNEKKIAPTDAVPRKFEDFPLPLPFTSEEGKVNFFWETVRGMAVFHFLCLGGREGGEKRETDDDALQFWALLENSTKFSFSHTTREKII